MKHNTKYLKQNTEQGITLVALVVTIVILLVLAGITVASLTGDNGLIGKTGEAKKQTEVSEGLEQLEIAVTQSTNKRGNIDETKLAKNLSKINGLKYINDEKQEVDVSENTEIKLTAKVKLKGNTFKINDEGKVSYKKDGVIDNEDIINSPSTYYGKYVTNYNSLSDPGIDEPEGKKWKLFMADDTNIYLIASKHISKDYAPMAYSSNSGNMYHMYFNNILGLYNKNVQEVENILGKLSNQYRYHEWLSNSSNLKNYANQKAVLSMLDSEKWNEYTDENEIKKGYRNSLYAQYVIGGPTLEMFCYSYNITHGGEDITAKPKDNENKYYEYGYKIKKGNADESSSVENLKAKEQITEDSTIDDMYFIYRYWLASPSCGKTAMMYVDPAGKIITYGYDAKNSCFRPLVCLKSNVHLIKNTDGETYSLELD